MTTAFTQKQIDDLNNSMVAAQNVNLGTVIAALVNNEIDRGTYTVLAADASASKATIPTEIDVTSWTVSILRSGSTVTADAYITTGSGTNLIVQDGTTYDVTAGDIINYAVW